MDGRNGLIVLGAYLTAAALIVVVACLGIFEYGVNARVSSLAQVDHEPAPELAVTRRGPSPDSSALLQDASAAAQQRIRVLESLLAEKTARLREQARLIKKKTSDYEALRSRYDETMALAVEYLGAETGSDEPANVPATERPASRDAAALEVELDIAKAMHEVLVSDLETLQKELAEARDAMEQLKRKTAQESTNQLQESLVLEAAAAGVLLKVGRQAVPALREALNHADPAVRRWAASVLGAIGPEAEDAVEALTESLSDSDESVRRAANAALRAIER